jgi:hypothetical protein
MTALHIGKIKLLFWKHLCVFPFPSLVWGRKKICILPGIRHAVDCVNDWVTPLLSWQWWLTVRAFCVRYAVLINEQFLWLKQHVITVRYKLRLKKQLSINHVTGPGVAEWVRYCATSQRVPGSIPGHWGFFPGHQAVPCALGSTQPLKMCTRIFLGCRFVRVTTLPPSCAECLEILVP